MTSMGNQTRVARMIAQWFTHYAAAIILHLFWNIIKYFQEFCDFLLGETINLLLIPHIPMNFDNF